MRLVGGATGAVLLAAASAAPQARMLAALGAALVGPTRVRRTPEPASARAGTGGGAHHQHAAPPVPEDC